MSSQKSTDYKTVYTATAQKDLAHLNVSLARKILKKIDYFLSAENPMHYAKKLKNFTLDTFRFRIGDYRVIFRLHPKKKKLVILVILKIAHRREAY